MSPLSTGKFCANLSYWAPAHYQPQVGISEGSSDDRIVAIVAPEMAEIRKKMNDREVSESQVFMAKQSVSSPGEVQLAGKEGH